MLLEKIKQHLQQVVLTTLWVFCEGVCSERLVPRIPYLEVRSSSLTRRVVFLDKELYSTLSLFTQVYNGYRSYTAGGGGGNPVMD